MKFAFEVAQKRPKKHLTVVTKSNAQRNGMVMWDRVAADVAKELYHTVTYRQVKKMRRTTVSRVPSEKR